jgi:2-polyprenyl-6-methoxyphenol hydroxylase-like FAD-dependent oxidoreductase
MQVPQHLLDDPAMVFFMGATGTFGYSGLTQEDHNKLLFWSVYQTDLPPREAKHDHVALAQLLKERHGEWADPVIRKCLDDAVIDTIYPIFVMPDLPHWGHDGTVLIGDAAHALPPRTGQGSSQAFEDALTLSLLLEAHLAKHDIRDTVAKTIQGLYDVRHGRTKRLKDKALAFPEPKMPMSHAMKWVLWAVMFFLTKITYITNQFAVVDKWNAKEAVAEYLQKSQT